MRFDSRARRRRRRRIAAALSMVLLPAPALFWTAVFAALAGLRPSGLSIERAPEAAQILIAAICMSVAVMLGCGALRVEGKAARGSARSAPAMRREKGSESF